MLKVLALVPDFIEKPSGGLGEQYRNMLNFLEGRVEYYTVGYPEDNKIKNYKSASNPLPAFNHASLVTIFGQSIYFLEGLKFNQQFDIIHAYDWSTFYAGYLCKEYFKKPLVCSVNLSLKQLNKKGIYYCHDYNTIDGQYINDLQNEFETLGLNHADKIVQVSQYYKSLYPEYDEKTTIVPNGLDLDKWIKKRNPKFPGKNKIKLCYIGRAAAMKGLDIILKCNIPDDIDFYFVVSSKNAEGTIYQSILQKCNNKNIFHIPGLYGQDKIDFLFSIDGIVMPSIHEPFGIVALEALMSESVLFTTAVDGIAEIVDGIEFVSIQTPEGLAKGIEAYKQLSQEQIKEMRKKGKQRAMQFSWQGASDKLYDLYKSLN
jgi:glycogen(starch) synthase